MPLIRSLLFAPANRPDLLRKFPRFGADAYAIDLEDGVPENEKAGAREGLPGVVEDLRSAGLAARLFVRINGLRTRHAELDLAAAFGPGVDGVVIPKLSRRAEARTAEAALVQAEARHARRFGVIGLIETAAGVVNVEKLAAHWRPRLVALAFGAEDFVTDVGGRRRSDSREVLYARSRVVLAARTHGIAALDQVYAWVRETAGFAEDAAFGRDLGYTGKMCVTPKQVELANAAFSPSAEEIARARRLIGVYRDAAAAGRGTSEFEGALVDEPMLRRAEAVVAWHEESSASSDRSRR